MATEFAWLIEKGSEPHYYAPTEPGEWTTDHLKACRFARKEDAEAIQFRHVIHGHLPERGTRVCEHGWHDVDAPEQSGEATAMDFSKYATTQFYAGKPTTARVTELIWDGTDYSLSVRVDGNAIVATMTGGNCEWKTYIAPDNFVESVNAALEDACDLGKTANWTNDE